MEKRKERAVPMNSNSSFFLLVFSSLFLLKWGCVENCVVLWPQAGLAPDAWPVLWLDNETGMGLFARNVRQAAERQQRSTASAVCAAMAARASSCKSRSTISSELPSGGNGGAGGVLPPCSITGLSRDSTSDPAECQ